MIIFTIFYIIPYEEGNILISICSDSLRLISTVLDHNTEQYSPESCRLEGEELFVVSSGP